MELESPYKDVMVVKHDYKTRMTEKYLGSKNEDYPSKNWSSVILWNCNSFPNRKLTPEFVQKSTGAELHRFSWIDDERIGELPPEWNWLDVEYDGILWPNWYTTPWAHLAFMSLLMQAILQKTGTRKDFN
jgi:hypothetical protein